MDRVRTNVIFPNGQSRAVDCEFISALRIQDALSVARARSDTEYESGKQQACAACILIDMGIVHADKAAENNVDRQGGFDITENALPDHDVILVGVVVRGSRPVSRPDPSAVRFWRCRVRFVCYIPPASCRVKGRATEKDTASQRRCL